MDSNKPIKNIMCTGGAGFIGTNIALEALSRGYTPVIVDNLSRPGTEENVAILKAFGIDVIRHDLTSIVGKELNMKVDAIIHLAANTGVGVSIDSPFYDFMQNAYTTITMLEIAKRLDIPLILASTNKVYGDNVNNIELEEGTTRYSYKGEKKRFGIPESFPTDSKHHTPYGASKLTADMYCQEYYASYGTKTVVNRMSCIYGLYQNGAEEQGWIDHLIRTNLEGRTLNVYGDGKQVRDVLWGGDVARLYIDELENIDKTAGQVFNIGGGKDNTLSLVEAMKKIESITGNAFNIEVHDWRPADQKVYISDIKKIRDTIGWKPTVTPEEGIHKIIDRYEEAKWR